jgi:hypothetical protein
MYECLTLKQPFAGADQLVSMRKHLAGEVPPLTLAADDKELEPQLQYITDKMLAMKLQNRYQSMQELESDLQECLAGTFKPRSVKAPPESIPSVDQKHFSLQLERL